MESEQLKKITKMVSERNQEAKKLKKVNLQKDYSIKLDTAFGINSHPICNQLQIVGEKYVIFMVGNIVVVRDVIQKNEKFYSYQNRFNNVTAIFGVSKQQKYKEKSKKYDQNGKPIHLPNTAPVKIYLAQSSENQQKTANIVVLKPYKDKLKILSTGIKGTVKQLTVDRSKKLIACLLMSVQSTHAVLFNYRKQKLLTCTSLKVPSIEYISIHPLQQKSVVLMGKNYIRLWELHSQQSLLKEQKQLVPLKVQKQNRFYDLSWQNSTTIKNPMLFVLTSRNKVLIIQSDTLVSTIDLTQREEFYSIKALKKGFCVGGANKILSIYEIDKTFTPTLILGSNAKQENQDTKIVRIHCSSNEGYFTVATTNQIGSFNFYYLNTFRIDADISSLDQFFSSGFHNKKINSLSTAVTKQLLVSSSQDNAVKIWNFFDVEGYDKKGLISHTFAEQPLCVSIHPCGLFVAVSFSSGFKVFAIVNDRLQVLKDIQVPNCKLIKYSHGGHFLAVNQKQHIFIYDSIYYETLHLFSLSNFVQQLIISFDDTHIITTCTSGYVYCFSLYESMHNKDYHNKKSYEHKQNSVYNCIAYDNKINGIPVQKTQKNSASTESDLFVGSTTQKYLVLYKNKCRDLIAQFPITDCHITSLLLCPLQGILLAGTSKGTLRVYAWPMTQNSLQLSIGQNNKVKIKEPQFIQLNAHSYPLVTMTASHDQQYLFTGSEDGTILCFTISSILQKQKKQGYCLVKPQDRKRIAQSANDLYLERVDRIEEKNQAIKKLKFQILRSEKKLKLEKEKLDIIYRQKMETLKKQYKITLETNKKIKDSYIQNSTKQYTELSEKLQSQKKRYEQEISKLKQYHKEKIDYQLKRNDKIRDEIEILKKKHTDEIQGLKVQHEKLMKKTKFQFYEKCHKLQIKYSNFLNQSKKNSQNFVAQLNQKQKQYEQEIQRQIRVKKQEIAKVKTINKELQLRNQKLTQQFNKLKKQDEEQQQTFEKLFKKHNDIRFQNLKSDEQILKMQHQLLERLQVIQSKQQTCKNARYEQTTLQNFRYMLDNKIQSLEQKKAEMIEKIRSRETDLKNMFNQLIKQSQENQKKSFQLKQLNTQIQVLQKQIKSAEDQIQKNEGKLTFFKAQVSTIANSDEDVKTIGKRLKKLVEQCEKTDGVIPSLPQQQTDQNDTTKQVNQQLNRQAKWMQKKLKMVKDIAVNYKQMREENINAVLAQNTKLIEECNRLRSLNQDFKDNIKKYQKQLSDLIRKKQKATTMKVQKDDFNLKNIDQKLKENEAKIGEQHNKLQGISQQIKQILKHSKTEAKLPAVSKLGNNKL